MDERKSAYALIITIVNRGYSDDVMDAARDAGARGGTVMYAHGAGLNETESFFGISIHPEKEMILIVSPAKDRNKIIAAVNAVRN